MTHKVLTEKPTDLASAEEECAIIERLKNGDRSAFATLYQWYGEILYRQAILPRLMDPVLAEDCLRDTFRVAMEKIETFERREQSIFFWLRRIAINKTIDVHRRAKRDRTLAQRLKAETTVSNMPVFPPPDQGLHDRDTQELVHGALEKLNPRYAQALRIRLLEDISREECARIMEITIANFDVILHRAAKAFRKVYP